MYSISDQQIDFILADIKNHGIQIEGLQQNLLDHVCIMIEEELQPGGDFETCYREIIGRFYKNELVELEEEALFLLESSGPRFLISRNIFFIILFIIFGGPFVAYDLLWFASSNTGNGYHLPFEIWGASLVFALFPNLVIFVLFFTPEKLDPLIPKKSKILLGGKSFIKIIPHAKFSA